MTSAPGRWASGLLVSFAIPAAAADYEFSWALPTPQGSALHGLAFASATSGVAVGAKGAVIGTTDGGATWSDLGDFSALSADLQDVFSLGGSSYIAVGAPPGISRSDDAGATWSAVGNPSTGTLEDVDAAGAGTLIAIGQAGQVVRSTDSGATWSLRPSAGTNDLQEQRWLDASTGFVVGDHLARRTTDGGATWAPLVGVNETEDFFNEILVATPSVLYAFADFHYAKSTDGGATWAWVFDSAFPVYKGKAIAFDAQHLMLVTDVEGAEVWESTNGAVDWTPILQRFDLGGFRELRRLSDGSLVTVSTSGDVFRSTNGGVDWTNATHSPDDEPRVWISALAVLSNGRAFAASTPPGTPLSRWHRSDDGGASWYEAATGPGLPDIEDLAFWDDLHGLASGSPNAVSYTTDGGVTWTASALPNAVPNGVRAYRLALPASGVAFCAADGTSGALVFRTTDFGASWEERSNGIPINTSWLGGVSFLDASTGYAAGGSTNSPKIWRTTDGGGSWSPVPTGGIPTFISDVHWFDAQNGLAGLHAATPGVWRTTDGGSTWSAVYGDRVQRFSFFGHRGYGRPDVWSYGHVAATEDAGATWQTVEVPADRAGTAVLALADGFLVGGAESQIVRATLIGATAAPQLPATPPDASVWLRAAPSIGREVALQWALPRGASYRVDVFDVAGRRVRSLASGRMHAAGAARATWDGRNDGGHLAASGTYFVRLRAGESARAAAVHLVR